MAKPDLPLNLALANLRRPPWPATLPDFGIEALPALPETPLLTADEALRLGLVAAHRFTCQLSGDRVDRFLASPTPRTIIIHAVDAEPAVPLLAFWLAKHVEAVAALSTHLSRAFDCVVIFALPHDLSERLRRRFAPLKPIRIVDAHYPGGNWRLMPRGARVNASRTLTLDSIAATDWISAMTSGAAAPLRPLAVVGFATAKVAYQSATRGDRVDSLSEHPNLDEESWFVGPRLTDQLAGDHHTIGDGELTFYREPRGERGASACIRCGACIAICPTRCDPVALLRAHVSPPTPTHHHQRQLHRAGLDTCIECGLCTAVCPADIELHHAIAQLRSARAERTHD